MQLITEIVHPELKSKQGRVFRRHAARGIVMRDEQILLLFTERYNDFSFPGGGLDGDEDIVTGLRRELEEETGYRSDDLEWLITVRTTVAFCNEFNRLHSHFLLRLGQFVLSLSLSLSPSPMITTFCMA